MYRKFVEVKETILPLLVMIYYLMESVYSNDHVIFGHNERLSTSDTDLFVHIYHQNLHSIKQSEFLDFQHVIEVYNYVCQTNVQYMLSFAQCFPDINPIESFAQHMQLPSLSLSRKCTIAEETESKYTHGSPYIVTKEVNIPDPSLIIAELILEEEWSEIIIITDKHVGIFPELELILSNLAHGNVRFSTFYVQDDFDIVRVVGEINDWKAVEQTVPHLVMCSMNHTVNILQEARTLGMRDRSYRWLIYNKGGYAFLPPHLINTDNIAVLTTNDTNTRIFRNFLYEFINTLHYNISESVSGYSSDIPNINKTDVKCRTNGTDDRLRDKIIAQMQQLNSALINNSTNETIYEVRSSITHQSGVSEMEQVATWDQHTTKLSMQQLLFPNTFKGFNQRVFTVVSIEVFAMLPVLPNFATYFLRAYVVLALPKYRTTARAAQPSYAVLQSVCYHMIGALYSFFQKKVVNEDGKVTWSGLTFQLLDELAKELDFSYVVTEPADGHWGIENPDGSWTGMIGMVVKQEVDLAAAGMSVTAQRDKVVDFPSPFFHDQAVVVIRRPSEQNRLFLYIYPLQWKVWAGTVGTICLCGPLLWLFTSCSPFYQTHGNPLISRHGLLHLDNSLIYIFGGFFRQGGKLMHSSLPGGILVGCFWFFSIVLMATYTGNLIATLAVSTVDMPFDTLSEMVAQTSISWGVVEGVAMVTLFQDAKSEPYTSVYDRMELVPDYDEGLRRLAEGDFGFISEKSWYIADEEANKDCTLAKMKEEYFPNNYALALQTGAPYLQLFSDKIIKIRETGLLDKWIKGWTTKKVQCQDLGPTTHARPVTVTDFQGALILLALGVGVGLLLLCAEIGVNGLGGVRKKLQN